MVTRRATVGSFRRAGCSRCAFAGCGHASRQRVQLGQLVQGGHQLAADNFLLQLFSLQLYESSSSLPATVITASDRMAAFSVSETASWLESCDAMGLATIVRSNGVNGKDLLTFDNAKDVEDDLRMTPFAARKLLALRDGYTQGA